MNVAFDAQWVGVVLSFITAVVALIVSIRGLRHAKRSADAAVRAVELAEKQAGDRPVGWRLEFVDDAFCWLINDSEYSAVDVAAGSGDGSMGPVNFETVGRIGAHQRELIECGPDEPVSVEWAWAGYTQRHSWTGWIPS